MTVIHVRIRVIVVAIWTEDQIFWLQDKLTRVNFTLVVVSKMNVKGRLVASCRGIVLNISISDASFVVVKTS